MISKELKQEVAAKAREMYQKAGIVILPSEEVEVADFGLNNIYEIGLEIVTLVNTRRCCAKEMVLLPGQTCPEHRHPEVAAIGYPGKEETFRCRYGKVYLYVEGPACRNPQIPPGCKNTDKLTVFNEVVLEPGMQYTLVPNTLHWFRAGDEGAVISEFSTTSYDEYDIFTDREIVRIEE